MNAQPELDSHSSERPWLPVAIAAGVVLLVVALAVLFTWKKPAAVTPINASADAYAASLPFSQIKMSESANLAGGKVTYLDGEIANLGSRTVTAVTVQVFFRNAAHEVAQNETLAMKLIRTRDPYVDLQPVSAAPLKSGDARAFRLIFDAVTPDWDGAYPEVRVLRVESH